MAASVSAGFNTFIPSFDASGQLIVAYSRNPRDFKVNQYTTLTPVKKSIGYYLRITAEVAGRILHSNLVDRIWHDGNDAPSLTWDNEAFEFQPYATNRYVKGFRLGYKAVDQADWKILASHAAIAAQATMTGRTQMAITALSTTGNYDSGHSGTFASFGGATANAGTVAAPALKKGLLAASELILKDTLGVVQPKDLIFVVNPEDARKIAASEELMDQFKQSQYAWPWAVEGKEVRNGMWGLPDTYTGIKIVVEDAVKVTSDKGETKVSTYVLPSGTGLLLARPGSLIGQEGATSYSTGHFFMYEEMTVEQRDDVDNRRHVGRVVEDYDFRVVAPSSGVVFSSLTT